MNFFVGYRDKSFGTSAVTEFTGLESNTAVQSYFRDVVLSALEKTAAVLFSHGRKDNKWWSVVESYQNHVTCQIPPGELSIVIFFNCK